MSQTPPDLHYTAEHEWVADPDGDGAVRVGITDFAQGELGDIVYVDLPEAGTTVQAGTTCGELESTKSVSDVYAPVSGTVTATNPALGDTPELVNSDPYGQGWLFEVRPDDAEELTSLMDATAYSASLES
ncbi:glycine cleavage system protein GcvH [uncultured Nocardioides sp.]|uniref:glycine cleavage system protein GcvH n=1 Tax=uncultured Nocardioides sp. TaxID=198441 RepID=UPI0026116950|nr:glycine cleavage system protein GcvH [uncultured Nocardioides sp.]